MSGNPVKSSFLRGAVDEFGGEEAEVGGGLGERREGCEGAGVEFFGVALGFVGSEEGDGGGLVRLFVGIEDVVDDLKGEAEVSAEGLEVEIICFVDLCDHGSEEEAGGDESCGFMDVHELQEGPIDVFSFPFQIDDLSADHAVAAC